MPTRLLFLIVISSVFNQGLSSDKNISKSPRGASKIRVLLITGEDVPAHNWKETSSLTRIALEETGKFEVRISEDIGILEAKSIHRYDVLIFNFRNNFKIRDINEAARKNLLEYVSSGKGLLTIHFAVAAFQNWPEYRDLIGRKWVRKKSGHQPRGPFKAVIASRDHPITKDLDDFEIDDELYSKLEGDIPLTILVKAHSKFSNKEEPLVWTHNYQKGRVLCITLGHDIKARRNYAFSLLLQRGAEWAATNKVAN